MKKNILFLLAFSAISVTVQAQKIYVFNKSGTQINCIVNRQQQNPITIRNNAKELIGSISSMQSVGVMDLKISGQISGRSMESGMYQTPIMDFNSSIANIDNNSRNYPNKDAVITVGKSLSPNEFKIQWMVVGRTLK
jgi:hypothetical protein